MTEASREVGVVVRRRSVDNPWIDELWSPAMTLDEVPAKNGKNLIRHPCGSPPVLLPSKRKGRREDGFRHVLAGATVRRLQKEVR